MKLFERRHAVLVAERKLQRERHRWQTDTLSLRTRLARHRIALILGGGFAGGMFAGLLPWLGFARLGGLLTGTLSFALRSPIGAMLVDSLAGKRNDQSGGN